MATFQASSPTLRLLCPIDWGPGVLCETNQPERKREQINAILQVVPD